MTPDREFVKRLVVLAEVMGEPLSEIRIGGYWAALADLPTDDLYVAMDDALRTSKFFPRPAELRTRAEEVVSKRNERRWALEGPPHRLRLSPGDTHASEEQWQEFLGNMRRIIKTMPGPKAHSRKART
jgi:hypothetical protein